VIPSIVAAPVGYGKVDPETMNPDGPYTTVSPFGSVVVWNPLPTTIVWPSTTRVRDAGCEDDNPPKVTPSMVIGAGPVGKGKVLVPIRMPLGLTTIVLPSGSTMVSEVEGIINVEPSIITLPGIDGFVLAVGPAPMVIPSVVIGDVSAGNGIVSVPITIPLGPNTAVGPSGSIIVVGEVGTMKVDPSITTSPIADWVELVVWELEKGVSVVPEIVVREPFGSVEIVGRMVVSDGLGKLLRVSVVPEIVVREPLGSVEVIGRIVVTDGLGELELEETVSVVPEIVVREPFGSVEVVGRMVVSDGLGKLLRVSVVPEIVVREPLGSVKVVGRMTVIDRLPGMELVRLVELVPPEVFVLVPNMILVELVAGIDEDGLEIGIERLWGVEGDGKTELVEDVWLVRDVVLYLWCNQQRPSELFSGVGGAYGA